MTAEDQENLPSSGSKTDERLLADLLNRLLDRDQARDDLERETVRAITELTGIIKSLQRDIDKPQHVPPWVIVIIIVLLAGVLSLAGLNVKTRWMQVEQANQPTVSSSLTIP